MDTWLVVSSHPNSPAPRSSQEVKSGGSPGSLSTNFSTPFWEGDPLDLAKNRLNCEDRRLEVIDQFNGAKLMDEGPDKDAALNEAIGNWLSSEFLERDAARIRAMRPTASESRYNLFEYTLQRSGAMSVSDEIRRQRFSIAEEALALMGEGGLKSQATETIERAKQSFEGFTSSFFDS